MNVVILVPSRLASTRLPNKPLADIGGKPMIVRVWERAQLADVGPVYVVAGDEEIVTAVQNAGGKAVMTNPELPSGSDRIWEGLQNLMRDENLPKPDIIINAQGDEPLLPTELIHEALAMFEKNPDADVVTFAHPITEPADIANPNLVKAVTASHGKALYFSREPIPHKANSMLRHIGFYAYRYAALEKFVQAEPSPLEVQEKLEQLRGLEMGLTYYVGLTDKEPVGVDTPADLALARELYAKMNG